MEKLQTKYTPQQVIDDLTLETVQRWKFVISFMRTTKTENGKNVYSLL